MDEVLGGVVDRVELEGQPERTAQAALQEADRVRSGRDLGDIDALLGDHLVQRGLVARKAPLDLRVVPFGADVHDGDQRDVDPLRSAVGRNRGLQPTVVRVDLDEAQELGFGERLGRLRAAIKLVRTQLKRRLIAFWDKYR